MNKVSRDPLLRDFKDMASDPLPAEALREKLKDYSLVRVYASNATPYAVITDLPEAEARRVAALSDPRRGEDNYDRRLITERWLRSNAAAAGVELTKPTPVYFALTNNPDQVLSHMPSHKKSLVLAADQVNLSSWSFTMDDHFFADPDNGILSPLNAQPHPLHGRVLNGHQLVRALETFGYPDDPFKNNIEAQMWAPEPTLFNPEDRPRARSGFASPLKANRPA